MSRHPDQALFVSPVPPDVVVDRSGGLRAQVSAHALRRYCERALGLGEERLREFTDLQCRAVLPDLGFDIPAIEARLAYYGGVAMNRGATVLRIDGVSLLVERTGVVVTIAPKGMRLKRKRIHINGENDAIAE